MDSLNPAFWIGLALAIPLSVVGNLLTPRFLQWLAQRSEARAEKRSNQLRTELEEIERLTSDPGRLQTFLLESVLLITLLTSMFGVVAGVLFALGNLLGFDRHFSGVGQLIAIGGGVSIMRECIAVLRKSRNARDAEKYRAAMSAEIEQLATKKPSVRSGEDSSNGVQ